MARTGLGRGLEALIGARPQPIAAVPPTTFEVPLSALERNAEQPRRVFDPEDLHGLVASIKEHGVLQPILVQRTATGYRLIAGERRVQAARLAGLTKIPALVRDAATHSALELALVENLQRTDLNAIEQAQAYRTLIAEHGVSQETLAQRLGRSPSAVSNTLRLLGAAQELQDAVIAGEITEGHLRALLSLPAEQARIAGRQVILNKLSVRQTEALVRRLAQAPRRRRNGPPADLERAQGELRAALGTKVEIQSGRRGGRIVIDFYSAEEFERLFDLLRSLTGRP